MKKIIIAVVGVIFISLPLYGGKIIMKFANIAPEDSPWHEALKQFKSEVYRDSGGQLIVKLYMGGRLGDENTMVEKTVYGAIECSGISTGAVATIIPSIQVFELPFVWNSYDEYDYVTAHYLQPYFAKKLRAKGLFLLGFVEHGWRNFHSRTKPIRWPDDLKGMRVRSQQSKLHVEFWKTLGAIPIPIPIPKVLDAFKNGIIEGGSNTLILTAALGWYQYLKYITLSRHVFQPVAVFCNLRWWNSLPEKLRKVILKNYQPLPPRIHEKLKVSTKELIKGFKSSGIQIIELTPQQKEAFKEKFKNFPRKMEPLIGRDALNLLLRGKQDYRKHKSK